MRSSSGSLAIFRRDPLRPHRHGEYSGTASERLSAFRANGSKDKAALPQNWDDLKRTCGIFVPRNAPRLFDVSYTRRRLQGACHEQLRFSEIHIVYRKQFCQFRCDHCRAKLRVQHYYWRIRFCSANCVAAYQKRLSKGTQAKIVKLDGDQIPLRLVS